MLRKNLGFTIVAIFTLALGIGVNTAAFTAYKAFFDQSLDARDPGKMVNLTVVLHSGTTDPYFSYPDYEAYRDRLHSFSGLIAESRSELLILSDAGGGVSQLSSSDGSLAEKLGLLPFSASNRELAATSIVSENYLNAAGRLRSSPVRGSVIPLNAVRTPISPNAVFFDQFREPTERGTHGCHLCRL